MKAISLTQPWASLVVEGHKVYETRSWATKYRGQLLIHASKGFPRWAKDLLGTEDYDGDPFIRDALNRPAEEMTVGAILGSVNLVDVQRTTDVVDIDWISSEERAFGDWSEGRYAWRMENPVKFQHPILVKGALGLWEVPAPILEEIRC